MFGGEGGAVSHGAEGGGSGARGRSWAYPSGSLLPSRMRARPPARPAGSSLGPRGPGGDAVTLKPNIMKRHVSSPSSAASAMAAPPSWPAGGGASGARAGADHARWRVGWPGEAV